MKLGTPGFVAFRLREAREARALTAVALAEMVGVTRQAISNYEIGHGSPRPEVLKRISEVLNVPSHRFSMPLYTSESKALFFRSMSAATKTARSRAHARYRWLREIVTELAQYVEFPAVNFPNFNVPADPSQLSSDDIERFAIETRRFWEMGDAPISNVVWLLENNGAIIARDQLAADTLDAFSEFVQDEQRPYIVLGADKGSALRSRFDAAHELGHVILHRNVDRSRLASTLDFKRIEDQAHWFAGAFLLPAKTFTQDLYCLTMDTLKGLSLKWKVSMGAMIKRAANLEFITEERAQRLWIQRSRLGYHKKEPLDGQLPIEQPRVLLRSMELCLSTSGLEPSQVLFDMALAMNDVQALCGLPEHMLSEHSIEVSEPAVYMLDTNKRSPITRPPKKGLAEIKQFPTGPK